MSMSALGSGGIRLPSYAREQAQTPRRQTPPGLLAQEDPVKVGNVCAAKGHPSASEIASVGKCESSTSAMVHPDDDVEMEVSSSFAVGDAIHSRANFNSSRCEILVFLSVDVARCLRESGLNFYFFVR